MNLYEQLTAGGGRQIPKKIVVHAMGEYIQPQVGGPIWSAIDWLRYRELSAHAVIAPSGVIIQTRAPHLVAWHAKGHNLGSLGVEFLVPGIHNYGTLCKAMAVKAWPSFDQYGSGAILISAWCNRYGISSDEVYTHAELDPERREDPGAGFDMRMLRT